MDIYASSLNKDEIITAVNDILLRAQSYIESDGEVFEYKLKSFKKRLNRYFFIVTIVVTHSLLRSKYFIGFKCLIFSRRHFEYQMNDIED